MWNFSHGPRNDDFGNSTYRVMVAVGIVVFLLFMGVIYYVITHSQGY